MTHSQRQKIELTFLLFSCFIASVYLPGLLCLQLCPFAGFVAWALLMYNMKKGVTLTILAGILQDLLHTSFPIGVTSLLFFGTFFILYRQKWRFSKDSFFVLPLITIVFSLLYTCIQLFFLSLLGLKPELTRWNILLDMVLCPILDGVYATVCIAMPMQAISVLVKKGFKFSFFRM